VPHTILLIDDEFSFLEALALLLTQEGYSVVTASDGAEALVRLGERRPDLVITDYWMPGMDGLELCRRLEENPAWRSIPVLLMTAVHDSDLVQHAMLMGVVRKPVEFRALLALMRRILHHTDLAT
jgi:two-component system sensor histidine kinase/response regulator